MPAPSNSSVIYRLDTGKIPAQRAFMESTATELMYDGAFGAGKSLIGCEKGLFLSLKYPGNAGFIFRKVFQSLVYTTMRTWFDKVCPPEYIYSYNKNDHIVTLTNGSTITFLGLDRVGGTGHSFDLPTKVGSIEAGWIFVDEGRELTEDDWIMLLGRLRLDRVPFRQIFTATNPDSPQHYLFQRFYIEPASLPDTSRVILPGSVTGRSTSVVSPSLSRQAVKSSTLDNVWLPEDYRRNMERFKGRYKLRYVDGEWVGFEGTVYDNFDPSTHIVDAFPIDSKWPVYRSIDFGYTNPFVCQWWAEVPSGLSNDSIPKLDGQPHPGYRGPGLYLFREIYYSGRTIEEHSPTIRHLSAGLNIRFTIADHDAEDAATLLRHGIPTVPAIKSVSPGIQTVYEWLGGRPQDIDQSLSILPRMYFFRDALYEVDPKLRDKRLPTNTLEEFPGYEWQSPRPGSNSKELPMDRNDHGMDAVRYIAYYLDVAAAAMEALIVARKDEGRIMNPSRWGRQYLPKSRDDMGTVMGGNRGRNRNWRGIGL